MHWLGDLLWKIVAKLMTVGLVLWSDCRWKTGPHQAVHLYLWSIRQTQLTQLTGNGLQPLLHHTRLCDGHGLHIWTLTLLVHMGETTGLKIPAFNSRPTVQTMRGTLVQPGLNMGLIDICRWHNQSRTCSCGSVQKEGLRNRPPVDQTLEWENRKRNVQFNVKR